MLSFSEVISNLYMKQKISEDKVRDFMKEGKLTNEEYLEILGRKKENE